MLSQSGAIGYYLLVGLILPVVIIIFVKLITPKRPTKAKLETYECGLETQGETWVQFKTHYFLYALVFVVFDVETIFLYPWAAKFKHLGLFAFVEMVIFIAILVAGFWYAWKEGALEWD
ncbi:NADH-quinone oxidoreductase subunit A [Candidatus Formimonas warabiya]|uniref:NADH-quinone oxidoreductase subunit A n=1 Tax=Formimonas warabiya TaxID=1761012 RepID=A0A3G1L061_FORW1|nr:NADH-quinone oxidoreductase subunit A [Candidatus Formimonas warabiya]ATW28029.1 NADH-quinone oxidoreductase subunit A [Candidatus Formimonas warabiya]